MFNSYKNYEFSDILRCNTRTRREFDVLGTVFSLIKKKRGKRILKILYQQIFNFVE